jgi:hypothetical protein
MSGDAKALIASRLDVKNRMIGEVFRPSYISGAPQRNPEASRKRNKGCSGTSQLGTLFESWRVLAS